MNLSFDFISKMYNNRNSYAEIFTDKELQLLHIPSKIEEIIKKQIKNKKVVFLTGNPGDGKTHLIRILESFLNKHESFVELDINEVSDYKKFIDDLENSMAENKPAIIAINEYPLYEFLKYLDQTSTLRNELKLAKEHSVIYGGGSSEYDYNSQNVVVIDLNNRNLLNADTLQKAMTKLFNSEIVCTHCDSIEHCNHFQNLRALQIPEIQKRIISLVTILGNIGNHAVMRDIMGLLAYTLTGGENCRSLISPYYDLLFLGENMLFEDLRILDPSHISHPTVDEELWNGLILEGWLLDPPLIKPASIENSEEAMESFQSLKRKYYFEHKNGMDLLNLYPRHLRNFLTLLKRATDEEVEILQDLILSLNHFYNPKEYEDQKLYIWNNHSYESKKYPETIISNRSIPFQNMKVLIPRLPTFLNDFDYMPDHFNLLIEVFSKNKETVELKVNFDLYKMLMLMAEGYPPQILSNSHKFTIERFMYKLSAKTTDYQTREFLLRSISDDKTRKILIRDGKYLLKGG